MKTLERPFSRRSALVGGAAAALAWAAHPLFRSVHAQQAAPTITAVSVAQVPTEPDDAAWRQAEGFTVALSPQNLVLPRLKEAGTKSIQVRALYDSERLALLLEWLDAHQDVDLGTVLQYRDAVAVQFPEDPSLQIPSFTMGQAGIGVVIYHWKSDWQFGPERDVDEAYPNMYNDLYPFSGVPAGQIPEATDYLTVGHKEYLTAAAVGNTLADPQIQRKIGPVQKMRAEGFGTIEPDKTQDASGKGAWGDGGWRILISVPRKQAKFTIEEGAVVPLGFAVWDGSRDERNGQKAYSYWNSMSVGGPSPEAAPAGGRGISLPLIGGIGGLIVAALAVVVGLRLWRASRRRDT